MTTSYIQLKKGEDRRIRGGHPWIFSNEIDVSLTPLKNFTPGQEVIVLAHDKSPLGTAYLNPHSLIAGRLFSREPNDFLTEELIISRIKKAYSLRNYLFDKPFYRLVFSESDDLPGLVVDRFENDFAVQINTAGMEHKKDEIISALTSLFPHTRSILFRNDSPIREQEHLECYVKSAFGTPPEEVLVIENDVNFSVPFWKGQKTGWFYDHRLNRAKLENYVKDKRILDVFSYVGGFGIQAAYFGAKQVDCIEASEIAGTFIANNAKRNHVFEKVNILCNDAFDTMKSLLHEHHSYDVIVLDPPAFVKKFKDRKEGLIAYQRLNEMAIKLLPTNGILVSCSCSMHVSMDDLIEIMQRISFRTKTKIQILERGHQGPDHPIHVCIPETDYLKALIVRKVE